MNSLQIVSNKKAISTLMMIILLLVAIIFGALMSYLWVMANFYLEPENTVDLAITEVVFPVNHADYFNFTIMNPTHSASGTNITKIYLTVEDGKNLTEVKSIYPETLPIPLAKGSTKTLQCFTYWGAFAGKEITVHVSSLNGSGAAKTVRTELVQLELNVNFNASKSCKEFSALIINNLNSIDLTLTKVFVNKDPLQNLTYSANMTELSLPKGLARGTTLSFRGFYDWEYMMNPIVNVTTAEGYWVAKRANATASVLLIVTNVSFDEEKPDEINVTIENSPVSKASVEIENITIGYDSTVDVINGTKATPNLPHKLRTNTTQTFTCYWSWRERRDKELTITVYTKQGYTPVTSRETVTTPPPAIIRITDLNFSLVHREFFLANVTNLDSSIQNVTVKNVTIVVDNSTIKINETLPSPFDLGMGKTQQFNCTFNWTKYEGKNVTVNIYTNEGFHTSRSLVLPIVTLDVKFDNNTSKEYFSIKVTNKALSAINITGIKIDFNGTLIEINSTYPSLPKKVENGETLTVICQCDWQPLEGKVRIILETANGFTVETEITVPDM